MAYLENFFLKQVTVLNFQNIITELHSLHSTSWWLSIKNKILYQNGGENFWETPETNSISLKLYVPAMMTVYQELLLAIPSEIGITNEF